MIQANELRIGNWILLDTIGLAYPHKITPKDVYDISSGLASVAKIEGLPLTPEILIAAGFREENKAEWSIEYENDFFIVAKNLVVGVEIYLGFDVDIYHEVLYERIKYVHQLQNLIYALSGNELTIKL